MTGSRRSTKRPCLIACCLDSGALLCALQRRSAVSGVPNSLAVHLLVPSYATFTLAHARRVRSQSLTSAAVRSVTARYEVMHPWETATKFTWPLRGSQQFEPCHRQTY